MNSIITNKAIYVHVVKNGYYLNAFNCRYCGERQSKGGIELKKCKHPICYKCFTKYVDKCMNKKKVPKCKKCDEIFDIKDIESHIIDDNLKQSVIKLINKKKKRSRRYESDDDTENESETESDSDDSDDSEDDDNSDSDSESDDESTESDNDTDSSLDYEDKLKKKLNGNLNDNDDKDKKPKKIKKKKNDRKKGLFYCASSKCDGYIRIKSKRKRTNKQSFKCPKCKAKNCIDCQVIHKQIKDKKIRKLECKDYQFLYNNKFLNRWKKFNIKSKSSCFKSLKHSKMMKAYKVKRGSIEWNEVISNMQTMNNFNVTRIERLQNSRLYAQYYKHNKRLILNRKTSVNEVSVWHGTRQTDPSVIWKGSGFDVRYANVGGCIWFAIQNNYSMGGYQFMKSNFECQVFLAFVASGDYEAVKFIRNGQILNVYKNETMYPAYLVTYQNCANMNGF